MDSKLLFALISTVALLSSSMYLVNNQTQASELQSSWTAWKSAENKLYSAEEEAYRFAVYVSNVAMINKHNAEENDWSLGVNKFADLTGEEFKAKFASGYKKGSVTLESWQQDLTIPSADSVDWVTGGAVNPPKDQGQCGSCWAFGTVGGIEGAYKIAGNPLTSFSEQQINSCDTVDGGCNGGDLPTAYTYVNGAGLCLESEYPYTSGGGTTGSCKISQHKVAVAAGKISGKAVTPKSRDAYTAALTQQPLSVCIEADTNVFQFYTSGVITSSKCGTQLDHCVTAVAFDTTASKPYTTIKNSWASSWGDQGYAKIGLSSTTGNGICGIMEEPYLAVIA